MMNVLNWVKNNKVVTGLGVLVLGGIALVLTSKNEETEEVATEVLDTEGIAEVVEQTND